MEGPILLIIPIAALIFIGGSYLMASRFLPAPMVLKPVPWMAGAALLGYFVAQFLFAVVLRLLGVSVATAGAALTIAVSLAGAAGAAALVLRGFVLRHRRRKAETKAQSTVF